MKSHSIHFLLLIVCAGLLFPSCTLEKRHYRNGFYIGGHSNQSRTNVAKSIPIELSSDQVSPLSEVQQHQTAEVLSAPTAVVAEPMDSARSDLQQDEIAPPEIATDEIVAASPPDEPKPPGNDKPNRKITLLTVLGIILVGAVLFLFIPGLSAGAALIFYLAPLLGVGIYFIAKRLRQKAAHDIANGAKDLNVSAHYYRFHLMLDLFFLFALIASVFLLLGNYTNVIAAGIIGAFGSVLTTGSILLTMAIAGILLVLLMFYLFRWRKDSTGYAPKRERHPRKDR